MKKLREGGGQAAKKRTLCPARMKIFSSVCWAATAAAAPRRSSKEAGNIGKGKKKKKKKKHFDYYRKKQSQFSSGMLPFFLAVLLLATIVPSTATCSTDADCGLLGTCTAGACLCDPGWVGPNCASLDLLPAPVDSGLRQTNSSNWCGTILVDEKDPNLFHSYNADFGGCRQGLNIWTTGSRVIHSTARAPTGPFIPVWGEGGAEVAVSAQGHNPQATRAPDGTFLLMDSYNGPDAGCQLEANYSTCHGLPGGGMCKPKMPSGGGVGWWVFHTSPSAAGPWTPVNVSVDFPCFSENLTPSPAFHPNGSFFIVFHCDADKSHKMCDLTMVRSDNSFRGPYVRVNDKIWDSTGVGPHPEDPVRCLLLCVRVFFSCLCPCLTPTPLLPVRVSSFGCAPPRRGIPPTTSSCTTRRAAFTCFPRMG